MSKLKLILFSILSGVLLSLAWTNWGLGLSLLVALVPLLLIENHFFIHKEENKSVSVFPYAYLTFFIWNLITTWWVYNSTAFGGIAAVILNSLFYAVIFWLFHIIKRKLGSKIGYFTLLVIWLAWEYIYINGEISWVWLVLGNGFANNISLVQWYEYTGTLGGSLWVVFINILIVRIIIHLQNNKTLYGQIGNSIIVLLVIILPITFSVIKYSTYTEKVNPINVVITQPNIDPYNMKFSGMTNDDQLNLILHLADSLINEKTDYVVGPETSIEDNIWENDIRQSNSIQKLIGYSNLHPSINLIIGATTRYLYENGNPSVTSRPYGNTNLRYDVFNTALQFSKKKEIDIYHKSKLVIGVEMFPYPKLLSFLTEMSIELGGTSGTLGMQDQRETFVDTKKSVSIAPIICYESIYGEFVTDYVKKGANAIFVITNDGWWGNTPGYKQHLSYSRLRAVENRRSIVRSANTGVSCFINQRGDVLQATEYWVKDAIKGEINLNNKKTFYTINGDFIGRIAEFLALLILAMFLVKLIKK
jgi:apolipoprotein N-acyltransferase